MQAPLMGQVETKAFGAKIFEQSETRRRALKTLSERPRFRTSKSAFLHFAAAILVGLGLGVMAYADLNSYHPEIGKIWTYMMASVGAITGSAALARGISNTRRLDAVAALLVEGDRQQQVESAVAARKG